MSFEEGKIECECLPYKGFHTGQPSKISGLTTPIYVQTTPIATQGSTLTISLFLEPGQLSKLSVSHSPLAVHTS